MPHQRKPFDLQDLPKGYRNLYPVNGASAVNRAKKKDKLEWRCNTCNGLVMLSLDNMEASPNREEGCLFCKSGIGYSQKLSEKASAVTVKSWYVDSTDSCISSPRQRCNALRYRISCEDGHEYELRHLQLREELKIKTPACILCQQASEAEKRHAQTRSLYSELSQTVLNIWGKHLQYKGYYKKEGSSSPAKHWFVVEGSPLPNPCELVPLFSAQGVWRRDIAGLTLSEAQLQKEFKASENRFRKHKP